MSTVIMSACWPLQGMSVTQKSVLISLADNANDQGVCWPSVETIAMRCCLSDRAVQKAIEWLRERGAVQLLRKTGRSTVYTVTPAKYAYPTSEQDSPPNEVHPRTRVAPNEIRPTPERDSPPPPNGVHQPPNGVHPNRKEPPFEPSRNRLGAAASETKKSTQTNKGTRLPEDWALTPELLDWSLSNDGQPSWTAEHAMRQSRQFRDHWRAVAGSKGCKLDWDATWRTWVRRAEPLKASSARTVDAGESGNWWESASGVTARGDELGVAPKGERESFPYYRVRVAKVAGRGPWIDFVLRDAERVNPEFYRQVMDYLGEALMPTDFYA